MKLHTLLSGAIVTLTLSTTTYAESTTTSADTKPTHSFGIQLGGGNMEYKGK